VLTPRLPDSDCPAYTLPRTYLLALGRGCLSRGTLPVKTRAEVRTVPRNGSGEPARAWSPAWDMIAAVTLRIPAMASARVMSDLPRWHTQRCGRCQNSLNSRYLHGQTRALAPYLLVRLRVRPKHQSPSTILRHHPPVTRS
jgi:hypothetical protein